MLRATCDVRRATCDVRRATCDVRRATCDVLTCHVRRATCDVPRAACYPIAALRCVSGRSVETGRGFGRALWRPRLSPAVKPITCEAYTADRLSSDLSQQDDRISQRATAGNARLAFTLPLKFGITSPVSGHRSDMVPARRLPLARRIHAETRIGPHADCCRSSSLRFCCRASSAAQAVTGVISGTVADPQGQVIPGATVTIINEANNDSRVAVSDAKGNFQVTNLQPGMYTAAGRARRASARSSGRTSS